MRRIAISTLLFLVSFALTGLVYVQPVQAKPKGVTVILASQATLIGAGQAVTIKVQVSCPKRYRALEAFVYVTQDDISSDFGFFPLQCHNKKLREYTVHVSTFDEELFHVGAATATAFVLLEPDDLSGGDSKAIQIQ